MSGTDSTRISRCQKKLKSLKNKNTVNIFVCRYILYDIFKIPMKLIVAKLYPESE